MQPTREDPSRRRRLRVCGSCARELQRLGPEPGGQSFAGASGGRGHSYTWTDAGPQRHSAATPDSGAHADTDHPAGTDADPASHAHAHSVADACSDTLADAHSVGDTHPLSDAYARSDTPSDAYADSTADSVADTHAVADTDAAARRCTVRLRLENDRARTSTGWFGIESA